MAALEITTFTWIGAALLGACGLFQALAVWRDPENARGLSWLFLSTWFGGEVAMLAGVMNVVSLHVLANYVVNGLIISYMAVVKYGLPKRKFAEH